MATVSKKTKSARGSSVQQPLGVVADVYPLEVFMQRMGLDRWAMREARANGLVTFKIGRRSYVRGEDFAAFAKRLAESKSHPEEQ